ncbi:ABC transporter ATP-binding protein [Chelativorans sp. AA-79]|uniref:ABC transporter ATP-binding protein n=1 Tax=Chelativorans sp. AA-79 TaxID=3028735 RepID=UPI0023F7C229|nr:ABC transporter ATP-binding protein [Chelativorans sp. AA-79]WEX08878.1 ABC transporter ATP-binding protein [Chelativorans sp. AA-79]
METTPVLHLKDLSVAFRGVRVVKGVTLTVPPGEAVGIIGETGSGKSTVARAILGLLPEETADIRFSEYQVEGQPVTRAAIPSLRGGKIAMIFQDPLSYLNPIMRIDKQIAESVRLHGKDENVDRRVDELLDLVRLPVARKSSYPHELSGGMRQRVLIAIAIACRPRLLIADEPTTALDVTTQTKVLELLHDIRKAFNTSILLISHDLGVISTLCEKVYVMRQGEFLESGSIDGVFGNPQNAYTASLLEADRLSRDESGRFKIFEGDQTW